MISIMLLAQAASQTTTIMPPMASFDLATVKPRPSRCNDIDFAQADTEVVVCATRPKTPAPMSADSFAAGPIAPEVKVLGGTLDVAAEQKSTVMGSAPAAMARFRLKF